MKERKDELRRKRGALDNSDLDYNSDFKNQKAEADLPSGIPRARGGSVSASHDRINFKSKLHSQIKQQEREAKAQLLKNF